MNLVKEENLRIRQENLWAINGIKQCCREVGIKRLKVAEEEIKAEVNKRVLSNERRASVNRKLVADKKHYPRGKAEEPSYRKTIRWTNYLKMGRCTSTLEAPRKRFWGLLRGFWTLVSKVFFKANRKALLVGSWKCLQKVQSWVTRGIRKCSSEGHKEERRFKAVSVFLCRLLMAKPPEYAENVPQPKGFSVLEDTQQVCHGAFAVNRAME